MRSDRLTIKNEITELRRMSEWLVSTGLARGISKDVLFRLEVCANEAVSNIISYAYDDYTGHEITLELNGIDAGARLVIRDDGKPFNPLEAPPHHRPASLADARVGGLGIHLIRELTSKCSYQQDGGFNVLCMEAENRPPKHTTAQ